MELDEQEVDEVINQVICDVWGYYRDEDRIFLQIKEAICRTFAQSQVKLPEKREHNPKGIIKEGFENRHQEMEDQRKRHHPYCWVIYLESINKCPWSCQCIMLKGYDKWRKDMAN